MDLMHQFTIVINQFYVIIEPYFTTSKCAVSIIKNRPLLISGHYIPKSLFKFKLKEDITKPGLQGP